MAYQPKSYRKFLAGTVTTALVASAVAPVAGAEGLQAQDNHTTFSDVNPADVHAPNIQKAVDRGLVNGYGDEFRPYNDVNRGQVALIISRYLMSQGVEVDTSETEEFADVNSSYYDEELYEASLVLRELGIFTGTEENNLNPNAPISRQAMAKVLVEAFGLEDVEDVDATVSDIEDAQEWAQEYINILVENGVTVVDEYRPLEPVSRAAFSTFVIRAIELSEMPEPMPLPEFTLEFNEEGNMFTVDFGEEMISEDVTDGVLTASLVEAGIEINGMEATADILAALNLSYEWNEDRTAVMVSHTDLDVAVRMLDLDVEEVVLSIGGVVATHTVEMFDILSAEVTEDGEVSVTFEGDVSEEEAAYLISTIEFDPELTVVEGSVESAMAAADDHTSTFTFEVEEDLSDLEELLIVGFDGMELEEPVMVIVDVVIPMVESVMAVNRSINSTDSIVIDFGTELSDASIPSNNDFEVRVNGEDVNVLPNLEVQGENLILTLSGSAITDDEDEVRIDYTPGTNLVTSVSGGEFNETLVNQVVEMMAAVVEPATMVETELLPDGDVLVEWDPSESETDVAVSQSLQVSVNGGSFVTEETFDDITTEAYEYNGRDGDVVEFRVLTFGEDGQVAVSETSEAVTLDGQEPELVNGTVNRDELVLTFDENFDLDTTVDATDFTVTTDNGTVAGTEVTVEGNMVTVELARDILTSEDDVTVTYTGSELVDEAGNAVDVADEDIDNITLSNEEEFEAGVSVAFEDTVYQVYNLADAGVIADAATIRVMGPDGETSTVSRDLYDGTSGEAGLLFDVTQEAGLYTYTITTGQGGGTPEVFTAVVEWDGIEAIFSDNVSETGAFSDFELYLTEDDVASDDNLDAIQNVYYYEQTSGDWVEADGTVVGFDTDSVSIAEGQSGSFELLVDYGDGTYYSTTIEMPEDSRPEIEDAEVNEAGTAFTATFSEDIATIDIDEDSENPFTVLIDGVEADVATVSNAGTPNELLFTFENTVDIKADATVTVSYDADADEVDDVNVLEDLNGNEAASFDGYVVDNSSAAPELLTATTSTTATNQIELKYDEAIRVASTMTVDGDDFRVMVGGAPVEVTDFAIVDTTPGGDPILDPDVADTIQLTLAVDVPANVNVTVTYNGTAIQDESGNMIPAITNQTVLNLNQN